MKNYYNLLTIALFITLSTQLSFSQNTEKSWSFEAGFSAIDLFPVGEDVPQGEYFDEFFNLNDHYNLGAYVAVNRNFSKNFSLTAKGTVSSITKWGEFGEVDESVLVDNLKYYGIDGMINYAFGKGKLQPYLAVGGGYTWIEEGPFNTFSGNKGLDNLVGAGTVNGSVGLKYALTDNVGLNLQTTYKHVFEDYLPKHWSHNLGVVFNVCNGDKKKEEEETNDRDADGIPDNYDLCPDTPGLASLGGCPDTDGDGVADKDDLCPTVKGDPAFGGCADSDNDGVPDNRDNCPTEKGTDNGCPTKVVTTTPTTTTTTTVNPMLGERKIYFDYNSSNLDLNAKTVLDEIASSLSDSSKFNISIDGHADSKGGSNYNYNLSVARANAVKSYLVSKGLTNASISTEGKGETQPTASNNTEAGRAENRRSVLNINVTAK